MCQITHCDPVHVGAVPRNHATCLQKEREEEEDCCLLLTKIKCWTKMSLIYRVNTLNTSKRPHSVLSPYVVSWLWHWLWRSAGPFQRCYRPGGIWSRYCCPPDPWWVLKFYSPRSWSLWLCPAFLFHPSTATKHTHTQTTHRLFFMVCARFPTSPW